MKFKLHTISNYLSFSRAFVAFPFAYYLFHNNILVAMIIAFYAFLSDYLDGYFARKYNEITEFGKIIDPIADKIFIGLTGIVLIMQNKISLIFALTILMRDLLILLGGIYASKKLEIVLPSNNIGKITVNILSLVLLGIIFNLEIAKVYGVWLAYLALYVSFIVYLYRMIVELRKIKK